MTAYGDPEYRAARRDLAHTLTPCWHGCGRVATSPDHVPPLAAHDHIRGSGCCALMPSCLPCNLAGGARYRNRHRAGVRVGASRRW